MPRHRERDRLSTGDALFLYLERDGMPLNVASISIFEGVISLAACRRFIESKLPLIPRYRQHVMPSPFNLGLPSWEYDSNFDIRNHVHEVVLENGTASDLQTVAGQILSQVMDRRRPLWDFTLVRGLKGDRTGLITRVHHCLADGLAGVSLMNVLMDHNQENQDYPAGKTRLPKRPPKGSPNLLDEVITSSVSVAEKVLSAQIELCNVVQQVFGAPSQNGNGSVAVAQAAANSEVHTSPMNDFAKFMPELTSATQPLPFNIICRGPQKFRWTEIPLAEIKAVKDKCGVTVNDVALTIVASAIQRYVESRGVKVRGRLLRIVMPVNVRGNGNVRDLGNRLTFVPITLPLDIHSPRKLLAAIHERTTFLKHAHIGECVGLAGTMLGTIPAAVQELVGPIVSQVPLGLCNIIFTNVPGPTSPLYLIGHKMLSCYPYVPIGGDLGINCAVLTYTGTAYFGFSGNAQAAPNLGRLPRFLTRSFAELKKAVRIRPQRPSRKTVEPRPSAAAPKHVQTIAEPPTRIPAQPIPITPPTDQKENEPLPVGA